MSVYWLSYPLQFNGGRDFNCSTYDGMNAEQCVEYHKYWLYWFESDHVYSLPTVAFFMCTIGVFIIGYMISVLSGYSRSKGNLVWRRMLATIRYGSYRGIRIKPLKWNSPPVGIMFLLAVGIIYFLCMTFVPHPYFWPDISMDSSPPLGTRAGWLAVACMPFVIATASKANWITLVTGVSHEKLQVFHRWISFAFFFLGLVHSLAFVSYHISFHDMVQQYSAAGEPEEYWTGIVILLLQAWLTFGSLSPIRKLGYEFFKAAHFFIGSIFIVVFFWHCAGSLTSWNYFVATAAIYVPALVYSWIRTYFEYGGRINALVSVEENDMISISVPSQSEWVPGQHCFVRFTGFGWQKFSSHPFSICSLPSATPGGSSNMVFYARHRGGLTARLFSFAQSQPKIAGVAIDGPYGGIDLRKFHSSDRILLIAGGSAVGWTLPFIAQFVRLVACSMSDDATLKRSMHVVLATRQESTRRWFLNSVRKVLFENAPEAGQPADLSISVYLTSENKNVDSSKDHFQLGVTNSKESNLIQDRGLKLLSDEAELSDSQSQVESQELYGRPNLPTIIREEAGNAASLGHSIGVYTCGPHEMQNDVRNAVAQENLEIVRGSKLGGSYLYCEHYSWA